MNVKALKLRFFFAFGDIFHLCFSFIISYKLIFYSIDISEKNLFLLIILCLCWLLVGSVFNIFNYKRASRLEVMLARLFNVYLINALIITALLFTINSNTFSTVHLYYTFFIGFISLVIWRVFAARIIKKYRKFGYNYKKVIIVGNGTVADQLYHFFSKTDHGFKLLALFYNEKSSLNYSCPNYSISELENYCSKNEVEEIYYSESILDENHLKRMMKFCDDNMIRLRITPDFSSFMQRKINIDFFGQIPIITLREEPLQYEFNRFLKRVFDIIFSLLVIVLIMSWLLPIIGLLIKVTSKGPIFFAQTRSGIDNKSFTCLKFRSMALNDYSDLKQATKNDPRVTKIGRLLRKSSLDEMPQFFNVLVGDMSVVGPRPHMLRHTEDYSKIVDGFMVRHLVLPGITGSAQVNGYRGETKSVEDMVSRVKYDVWYLENWTLLLDLKLILLTVVNLIKGNENAV